jgi:hypothetical protein
VAEGWKARWEFDDRDWIASGTLTLDRGQWRIVGHFAGASRSGTDHTVLNHAKPFYGYEHTGPQGVVGYRQQGKAQRVMAWIKNPRNA